MKMKKYVALFVSAVILAINSFPTAAFADGTKSDSDETEAVVNTYNKFDTYFVPVLENAEDDDQFHVLIIIEDSKINKPEIREEIRSRMIEDGTWDEIVNSIPKVEWTEQDDARLQEYMLEYHPDDPAWMYDYYKRQDLSLRTRAYNWEVKSLPNCKVSEEVYKQENPKVADELGIKSEDIIEIKTYGPILEANLSKSEILRISENDLVTNIGALDIVTDINLVGWGDDVVVDDAESKSDKYESMLDIVSAYSSGDFDMNGSVDSADALAMLRGSVNNKDFSGSEIVLCDLDDDGNITSNDALIVLRRSVGYTD